MKQLPRRLQKAPNAFAMWCVGSKRDPTDDDIELTLTELRQPIAAAGDEEKTMPPRKHGAPKIAALEAAAGAIPLKVKRADLTARTPTQLTYLQNIRITTSPLASARPAPARPSRRGLRGGCSSVT